MDVIYINSYVAFGIHVHYIEAFSEARENSAANLRVQILQVPPNKQNAGVNDYIDSLILLIKSIKSSFRFFFIISVHSTISYTFTYDPLCCFFGRNKCHFYLYSTVGLTSFY